MVDETSYGVLHFHWIVLCVLKNYLCSGLVAIVFVLVDWFPVVESVLIVIISIVVVSGELVAIAAVVVEVDVVSLVAVLSVI